MHYTIIVIRHSKTCDILYSLSHKLILYCTAVLVESLMFLLCNQQIWRSDVKYLAKARMFCLVKPADVAHVVVVDECEVVVK